MTKYGRFASKKSMDKANSSGLGLCDFTGEGKITMDMINKKLKPKKIKKPKKEKRSAYKAQYFNGHNEEQATLISNMLTENHSDKIKAGNRLECDVADDIKEHSLYSFYKAKNINDPELSKPCVIASCRFSREQYEEHGLKCKNKKEVEVDMVIINTENHVSIVEIKNGCNFDTKKSKGEVQSLEATKILCEKMGFKTVECCICCYDAITTSDIKLKTTMGQVKTILYSELCEKCGLSGVSSRGRLDIKVQNRAERNIKKMMNFAKKLLSNS